MELLIAREFNISTPQNLFITFVKEIKTTLLRSGLRIRLSIGLFQDQLSSRQTDVGIDNSIK